VFFSPSPNVWYLDDGTLVGDSGEVAKALDIIQIFGLELSLELNIRKTEIYWPSCDCNNYRCNKLLFHVCTLI